MPNTDPSNYDPGDQYLGQPSAQHRAGLFAGGAYIGQLWLFWLAPIIGAAIAGFLTRWLYQDELVTVDTVVVEQQRIG